MFTPTQLAARAAYLLRGNDRGTMTSAAPKLYPHMWSWDAAFVAVGLAPLSVERAVTELDTLLSAQWANGMIPHIVFANGVDGYFPGPARWQTSELAANAPSGYQTSGITQPPVHAIAVQRILDHARRRGRSARGIAEAFLDRRWTDLMRWHRWLAETRDQNQHGRITLYHGWESGMDNSPRWDGAYANVVPGELPPYTRADTAIVTDPSQRPKDAEYDVYLWLLEEMKSVRYDDARLPDAMSFAMEDVFVSAIFSVACEVLATIGEEHARPRADVRELHGWAERFRQGVLDTTEERSGAARDFDVKTGKWVATDTVAVFAPLLSGGMPRPQELALLRLLEGPRFCGHPDLRYALVPSTSPVSRDFRPREYWRGPVWPGLPGCSVGLSSGVDGANARSCCGKRDYARRATDLSRSITSRSLASPWAVCSNPGRPQRFWTGWARSYSCPARRRSSGVIRNATSSCMAMAIDVRVIPGISRMLPAIR
ncbi:Uncharacterised protein [Mycobacteroides abscessus]|nr:Uncharacterised protein [Mycobacteroides abscessus]